MKFICRNSQCHDCGVVYDYPKNTYKMVNGRLLSNNAICPKCGHIRDEVNDGDVDLKSLSVGKYSSASLDDKRDMLKKRSHDHFNKEIKEYKDHQLNEAMGQFKKLK